MPEGLRPSSTALCTAAQRGRGQKAIGFDQRDFSHTVTRVSGQSASTFCALQTDRQTTPSTLNDVDLGPAGTAYLSKGSEDQDRLLWGFQALLLSLIS